MLLARHVGIQASARPGRVAAAGVCQADPGIWRAPALYLWWVPPNRRQGKMMGGGGRVSRRGVGSFPGCLPVSFGARPVGTTVRAGL